MRSRAHSCHSIHRDAFFSSFFFLTQRFIQLLSLVRSTNCLHNDKVSINFLHSFFSSSLFSICNNLKFLFSDAMYRKKKDQRIEPIKSRIVGWIPIDWLFYQELQQTFAHNYVERNQMTTSKRVLF